MCIYDYNDATIFYFEICHLRRCIGFENVKGYIKFPLIAVSTVQVLLEFEKQINFVLSNVLFLSSLPSVPLQSSVHSCYPNMKTLVSL